MYSQCPECLARFRVTADALRAARGTVRCGRCGSAFDALARLSDTIPADLAVKDRAAPGTIEASHEAPRETEHTAEYHFTADDIEKVFVDAREWQRQYGGTRAAPNERGDPSGGEASELLVDETESLEDITLEGERIQVENLEELDEIDGSVRPAQRQPSYDLDATDRFAVLEAPPGVEFEDEEPGDFTAPGDLTDGAPPPAPIPESRPATGPGPIVGPADARDATDADDATPGLSRSLTLAWSIGCLAAALALAAQFIHYFRQDLARQPQVGPALVDLYSRLRLPLTPNWDPRALQLRQWSGDDPAAAGGALHIQASITNRAAFAQPLPLLRLQLEDRYGESVAARDFEPAEYLRNPVLATRLLTAGTSIEADLRIAVPGGGAVGYRIDLCLRESATVLRCAQGPGG
jgi:predicted Zn finger-like uncharacterized protein